MSQNTDFFWKNQAFSQKHRVAQPLPYTKKDTKPFNAILTLNEIYDKYNFTLRHT